MVVDTMGEDEISRSIKALTTDEHWEGGLALFSNGGVMNVQYTARAVEARVVNDAFAFERVSISFRGEKIVTRCSCNLHNLFCKHVIALLLYIAKETPELLNCLLSSQNNTSSGTQSSQTENFEHPIMAGGSVSIEAIRDFLSSQVTQATLSLHCDTEIPQLTLAKQQLTLQATINYRGNTYTQGNIRKLVENGAAAGKMHLTDFAPQSQQVMRFLVQYAQFDQTKLTLDTEACADLFHCLRGSCILSTPSGAVQFHLEPLQIQFCINGQSGKKADIQPCLLSPNRGILPGEMLTFVAGRGGYWIGKGLEYWWFPGIIPFNWLRLFIQGKSISLTNDEITRLTKLCESRQFPGKVKMTKSTVMREIVVGKLRPVFTMDWDAEGLLADLQFEYSGKRVEVGNDELIWSGTNFVKRDLEGEQAAQTLLKEAGFVQEDETWHHMRLSDKELIWKFIHETSPTLTPTWQVFWTPQVRANALATSDASMSIKASGEGNGWFETSCDLKAADGTPIPFALALEAVKNDDDFIRLPNGAVARLSQDLFDLIQMLLKRATERHDNRFNLKNCHAIALVDAMNPYWSGPRPDWYLLKDKIMHPERTEMLDLPGKLNGILRDYQKEGVKWLSILDSCGFHGVLADEMGLGKTAQALSALAKRKASGLAIGPSIVVCPTSLLENWRVEAEKFTPELRILIITGLDRTKLFTHLEEYDLIITSYALLRRDVIEYDDVNFDYVILDEAQHIKNAKTANAQACKDLKAEHRLVLTGTPMENTPSEIWSIFDFLQPGYLGSQHEFRQSFEARHDPVKQARMAQQLSGLIRPFVLRRTKAEVCSELPPKLEQDMFCEMGEEQRRLYDNLLLASRSFLEKIHSSGLKWSEQRMEMLAMITRLRQACCHPALLPKEMLEGYPNDMPSVKMDLAREVILEAIDSGHRILLFSQFTSILKLFPDWLKKSHIAYECIDGSTKERQKKVDRFNNDPSIPVFLLSLKAGGVGLNLPGADTVIHYDQWWNPMVEDQATDRTHRIGQTRTVTSIRLVTRNTIEEKILRLQDAKRDLFNKILGEAPSAISDISQDDIEFLLQS